jgi:hypothetical protein
MRLRVSWRLVAVGLIAAVFVALWRLVPPEPLFWVLALLVTGLAWMASYGYRVALRTIANLAEWLERLEN